MEWSLSGNEGIRTDWKGLVIYLMEERKMKEYEVKIKGMGPMLQNRLSRELNKEKKKVPKDKLDEWEDENYKRKLYVEKVEGKEQVIVPSLNIHAMLVTACKKYKVSPPKSVGRTWTDYFRSCVIIPNNSVVNHTKVEPFGTMVNGNPSSAKKSSKVYCVRPMLHDWTLTITIQDWEEFLKKDDVEEIIRTAGKYIGLSDFRPQYGRFVVESIKAS